MPLSNSKATYQRYGTFFLLHSVSAFAAQTTAEWFLLSNMTAFYSLLSGNKELREICTDLSAQVDFPGLCWFILAGFVVKLCVGGEKKLV